MDEFVVINVMNEAMIRLKRSKNQDASKNEKIKEFLKDRDFFFKINKDNAIKVLGYVGVADDKLEETYKKLTNIS